MTPILSKHIPKWINLDISVIHEDIIFDIQNITHKYGRSKDNGENVKSVALMQVDNSEQDSEIINRLLTRHIYSLYDRMDRYTTNLSTETFKIAENNTRTKTTYKLTMPPNWPNKKSDTIRLAMHDYLVYSCIADHLNIVNPQDAGQYRQYADDAVSDIKYALNTRIPGTRRIPYSFKG